MRGSDHVTRIYRLIRSSGWAWRHYFYCLRRSHLQQRDKKEVFSSPVTAAVATKLRKKHTETTMKVAVLVLALIAVVQADMYLHNPRGSNNRLDEARRDRNNANRLFDSQNNNRGGYNVGSLYYYEGSVLPIEWTNQHSCGNPNNFCEIVFQYMCGDLVRDGATTTRIPEQIVECENLDCNTDLEYGMHEDFDYYQDCKLRSRNMGLFLADRDLRGVTAIYTRQNEQGTRRGYECPEERDYYPYWHPTPWRDIAVLTNDPTRCVLYQAESENVKSRFRCNLPEGFDFDINRNREFAYPITQEECEAAMVEDPNGGNATFGEWVEFPPQEPRLPAPHCVDSLWSRDNHLGNGMGGFPNYYNWTIPNTPHEHCVLRARYNISTGDYEAWGEGGANSSLRQVRASVYNGPNGNPLQNRDISELDVYSEFGFDTETAAERGYVFRQNPVVKIFPDISETANNIGLQLAINTNQFGRTFQDRSHTFAIRSRPEDLQDTIIHNLNVRGKRGNIVQVYPGVEYDMVPNRLEMAVGDAVHIQWTGSNTNPNNNDGQGRQGTDRSNIVLLREPNYAEGDGTATADVSTRGHWGNSYPGHLDDDSTFLGLSRADRQALALLDNLQYGGEMSELDDAGTYFDLGPRKITSTENATGTYYYMCTRNNNFTNRSQKGRLTILINQVNYARIGWPGGEITVDGHTIRFDRGDLTVAVMFRLERYTSNDDAEDAVREENPDASFNAPANTASDFIRIEPLDVFDGAEGMATVSLPIDPDVGGSPRIFRANPASSWNYEPLETEIVDGRALAQTDQGGVFVAASGINYGAYVGIAIAVLVVVLVVIAIVGVVVYFAVRPEKWQKTRENVRKTKTKVTRSFAKQV